jgi:hypothetical protein
MARLRESRDRVFIGGWRGVTDDSGFEGIPRELEELNGDSSGDRGVGERLWFSRENRERIHDINKKKNAKLFFSEKGVPWQPACRVKTSYVRCRFSEKKGVFLGRIVEDAVGTGERELPINLLLTSAARKRALENLDGKGCSVGMRQGLRMDVNADWEVGRCFRLGSPKVAGARALPCSGL